MPRFKFIRDVAWTGAEKVLVQCVGVAQGVVLARMLEPGDFGLMAILAVFFGVGRTLADSGLGTALVVMDRDVASPDDSQLVRSVRLWNVGIALGCYALVAAGAPLIARFYGEPLLAPLAWVAGVGMVLDAACGVGIALLTRARRFRELAVANAASFLAAAVVAIGGAAAGWGVWAIAGLGVVSGAVRLVLVHIATRRLFSETQPSTVHLHLSPSHPSPTLSSLLSYGWKLTLSGLVHTVYLNSYQLVVGKLFSPAAVGLFSRGQRWATLPVEVVNESVGRIVLPDLARGTVGGRRAIALNALLLWPCLAVLAVWAPEIVGFVLGPKWLDCVPYLRILVLGVAFTPVTNVAMQYLRAKGRADLVLATDAVKKPIGLAALVVGAFFGMAGLCWAKVASDIAEAVTDAVFAWRLRVARERLGWRTAIASGRLRRALRWMHRARTLDRMLAGRTIAVVGNGPSEIGKGLGAEIDAHEVVIRFNNYRTEGFERDYGKRTDVWVKNGADNIRRDPPERGVHLVLYVEDILRMGLPAGYEASLLREVSMCAVDHLDLREREPLLHRLGCLPTAGAFVIDRLRRVKGATVDAYGFGFLDPGAPFKHYAEDQSADETARLRFHANHDFACERNWMSGLFKGRRLTWHYR